MHTFFNAATHSAGAAVQPSLSMLRVMISYPMFAAECVEPKL
jgi:hypothetical protein